MAGRCDHLQKYELYEKGTQHAIIIIFDGTVWYTPWELHGSCTLLSPSHRHIRSKLISYIGSEIGYDSRWWGLGCAQDTVSCTLTDIMCAGTCTCSMDIIQYTYIDIRLQVSVWHNTTTSLVPSLVPRPHPAFNVARCGLGTRLFYCYIII